MDAVAPYEDRFGPFARRFRRLTRSVRWNLKGLMGRRRTLLVELRWRLGDEIMALPILEALRNSESPLHLQVLTNYPDLFSGVLEADDINPQRPNPDRYVLLRSGPRDVYRPAHYARLAGVPTPQSRPRVRADGATEEWQARLGRRVVIAPGASWDVKRWPRDSWRELVDALEARGCEVIVLGNDGEAVGAGHDRTGQTTITECARILKAADLCVCSDSGLMHLALAVETSVVALFGPTGPEMLIREEPLLHFISNNRECSNCWNGSQEMRLPGECPRGIDPCLGTIEAKTVLAHVERLIDSA